MDAEEYLLIRLIEELSEMQHAISKCLRFGVSHVCIVQGIPNIEKVRKEAADVLGTIELLREFDIKFDPTVGSFNEAYKKVKQDLLKWNGKESFGVKTKKYLIASSYKVAQTYAKEKRISYWKYLSSLEIVSGLEFSEDDVVLVDEENFTQEQYNILVAVKPRIRR